ncbi:YbhB/YbcL family Raf kinase inhibitor-like protein [uncultured Leifsonia sp.]|uniref:YbhB/YbcL family Raf kinase inhibitor-like protein n=1 Tax=uncultured Leifsonia sp. TaxID=340359 RepID=UPI0028D0D93A|nr:YbhB/YbcL family Raf kinase inhibitor-like protein [uncultured Leifsonia sp.]
MTDNDPFARLPEVPSFAVTSSSTSHGAALARAQRSGLFGVAGGRDRSPQLSWTGAPDGTKSYVVTVYDPDAPTGSGFWHWAVADIPATTNTLEEGAGAPDSAALPHAARQLRNDAGLSHYLGAAPPDGHGRHRYYITVNALDVERLDIPDDATPAFLGFALSEHIVGRAVLIGTADASD